MDTHDSIVWFMSAYIVRGESAEDASSLAIDAWRLSNNALEYIMSEVPDSPDEDTPSIQ